MNDVKSLVTNETLPIGSLEARRVASLMQVAALKQVTLSLLREVEAMENLRSPDCEQEKIRLPDEVRQFEIELIRLALARTRGHQTRAAQLLGINLTTLNSKIKRYRI